MTTSFPERQRRTEAPGVTGALLWFGLVTGTVQGGTVVTGLDWRWATLIPVFVGGAVLACAEAGWPGLPMLGSPIGPALRLGAFLLVEARHRYLSPRGRPTVGQIPFGRYGGRACLPHLYARGALGHAPVATGSSPRAPPRRVAVAFLCLAELGKKEITVASMYFLAYADGTWPRLTVSGHHPFKPVSGRLS
ncbi:hypothetical protein [Nonomuraea longicatena]|uniref:Uncharacterized protein n=1 Tax=Nonomuraea longicatena TaxID=83682 RepID=A0ABN1PW68_9ACTN